MAGPCPVRATTQTQFDVRNTTSCVDMVSYIFQAYVNATVGDKTVVVRFGERWTEYGKPNIEALQRLYMMLYTQCPAAAAAGLPNLNPANAVRRGAPARAFFNFPRL